MSTISQKQAVVNAVSTVLGGNFTPSETVVAEILTKEQKSEIRSLVKGGILNGSVVYNKNTEDEKEVNKYISSMVDNHIRKAKILNGDSPYKPSKKGTRRDEKLKELTKLRSQFETGSDQFNEVQSYIVERNSELDKIKVGKKSAMSIGQINTDVLPVHLRNLVNNNGSAKNTTNEV